ncbi:MAG: hypothetical protein GYA14_10870 [Ignavibacteria bacterium]|nr:hypothetical protein [Ignavibacteria bacterium]
MAIKNNIFKDKIGNIAEEYGFSLAELKYMKDSMLNIMKARYSTKSPILFYCSLMVSSVFIIVAGFLQVIARLTRTTYNQVNIIVYYAVIPLTWFWILDSIFGFHYMKIIYGVFCVVVFFSVKDFRRFCDRMFEKSVDFLNYFNRWGSNYWLSSVVICVVVPLIIYAALILILFYK